MGLEGYSRISFRAGTPDAFRIRIQRIIGTITARALEKSVGIILRIVREKRMTAANKRMTAKTTGLLSVPSLLTVPLSLLKLNG